MQQKHSSLREAVEAAPYKEGPVGRPTGAFQSLVTNTRDEEPPWRPPMPTCRPRGATRETPAPGGSCGKWAESGATERNPRGAVVAPDGAMGRALLIGVSDTPNFVFLEPATEGGRALAPGPIFCWPNGPPNQGGDNLPTLSLSRQWAAAVGICFTLLAAERPATAADLSRIETIVVLYPENRSFDHLYGLFPGRQRHRQRHHGADTPNVITMARYCPICASGTARASRTRAFRNLPNAPFRIDAPPVG